MAKAWLVVVLGLAGWLAGLLAVCLAGCLAGCLPGWLETDVWGLAGDLAIQSICNICN